MKRAHPSGRRTIVATTFALAFCTLTGTSVWAEHKHTGHAGHGRATKDSGSKNCAHDIALSNAAEKKAGGSLFNMPATTHHGHDKGAMDHMKGAHMRHQPRHGGAFYMAPNKMHHLEIIYSDACGFSVIFYNAFTEAIRADRFQAFLTAVPEDESEAELVRILAPAQGATMLHAPLGETLGKPFQIRLYVKFPGAVEPQLFTTRIE